MRSSLLLHPIAAWRQHERPASAARTARSAVTQAAAVPPTSAARTARSAIKRAAAVPPTSADPAVARGRDAGGPVDEACYPCSCGYFFIAPVSANVTCPHCGAHQAW